MDVVTGAFSFTGRYIAARLLEAGREVRTVTRRRESESPFGDRVRSFPTEPDGIAAALDGAETLYNTYWIRFPNASTTFEDAVGNSVALFDAARAAGVQRVVQLSVTNAGAGSPYAYFRGKAAVDEALAASGLSHAIVRPTLVFGDGEVLLNNVAWLLRRLPLFVVPRVPCRIRPIAAEELAQLCVEAGRDDQNIAFDAAGPDELGFEELVRLVRSAVGSRAVLARGGGRPVLALTRALGLVTRETLLTAEELGALADDLLTSDEAPLGTSRVEDWIADNAQALGRQLATGERRPWPK